MTERAPVAPRVPGLTMLGGHEDLACTDDACAVTGEAEHPGATSSWADLATREAVDLPG
jgi:hypothetical protein